MIHLVLLWDEYCIRKSAFTELVSILFACYTAVNNEFLQFSGSEESDEIVPSSQEDEKDWFGSR